MNIEGKIVSPSDKLKRKKYLSDYRKKNKLKLKKSQKKYYSTKKNVIKRKRALYKLRNLRTFGKPRSPVKKIRRRF